MSNETETMCGNCGLMPVGEHSTYAESILVCQQCIRLHCGDHGLSFMAAYALGVKRGREAGMTEIDGIMLKVKDDWGRSGAYQKQNACDYLIHLILTARDAKKV